MKTCYWRDHRGSHYSALVAYFITLAARAPFIKMLQSENSKFLWMGSISTPSYVELYLCLVISASLQSPPFQHFFLLFLLSLSGGASTSMWLAHLLFFLSFSPWLAHLISRQSASQAANYRPRCGAQGRMWQHAVFLCVCVCELYVCVLTCVKCRRILGCCCLSRHVFLDARRERACSRLHVCTLTCVLSHLRPIWLLDPHSGHLACPHSSRLGNVFHHWGSSQV